MTSAVDLYVLYKFIKAIATPFDETKAFELGIVDKKGKLLKKPKTKAEKDAYDHFDRFTFNIKRILQRVGLDKTYATYAGALLLMKEGAEEVLRKTFAASTNTSAQISQQLGPTSEGYTLHIETTTAFTIDSCAFTGIDTSGNQYTSQINSAISVPLEKEFIITDNIPSMKVIDFMTGLFKMFNLTAFIEDDGTIKVQTLDSFYAAGKGVVAGTEAWALDDYIDTTSSHVKVALTFKKKDVTVAGVCKQ